MKIIYIIHLVFITLILSCQNNTLKQQTNKDTDDKDLYSAEEVEDTIADIKFKEFSLSINRLSVYDEENNLDKIQTDTVLISAELGESVEGSQITVTNNELSNITIEHQFETSITIMDEGPHCDLLNWKHYYSNWTKLDNSNNNEQFIFPKYTEEDTQRFPKTTITELKSKVKKSCGEEMFELIKNTVSINEYPIGVGISKYFLRITGQQKGNNKKVTKYIIIESPMGC